MNIASRATRLFAALALVVLFNSCAVMFGGSKYNANIAVENDPNAEIYINGMHRGTGSTTLLLPRNKDLNLDIKKEDCEDQRFNFPKELRATFVLDFLTLYLWIPAMAVDFATGATYKPDMDMPGAYQIDTKNFEFKVNYTGCPDDK